MSNNLLFLILGIIIMRTTLVFKIQRKVCDVIHQYNIKMIDLCKYPYIVDYDKFLGGVGTRIKMVFDLTKWTTKQFYPELKLFELLINLMREKP